VTTRVLCTFGATYGGGTLRLLTDGLPHLNRRPGIQVTFGDLYEREDIKAVFRSEGVPAVQVGVKCAPYTSVRRGLARRIDRLRALPRHCLIAHRLRRAAQTADVVYVHTYKELVLTAWSGARIVWHCHGLDGVPPFTAFLARACVCVLADSDAVAEQLRDIGVPGDRIITVLNAIDLETRAYRGGGNRPLRHSQFAARHPWFCCRQHRSAQLREFMCFCGQRRGAGARNLDHRRYARPGRWRLCGTSARSFPVAKVSGRVHFLGFRSDIYRVMRAADIVCVPSVVREGFGPGGGGGNGFRQARDCLQPWRASGCSATGRGWDHKSTPTDRRTSHRPPKAYYRLPVRTASRCARCVLRTAAILL